VEKLRGDRGDWRRRIKRRDRGIFSSILLPANKHHLPKKD
jgi:hypothetical protein